MIPLVQIQPGHSGCHCHRNVCGHVRIRIRVFISISIQMESHLKSDISWNAELSDEAETPVLQGVWGSKKAKRDSCGGTMITACLPWVSYTLRARLSTLNTLGMRVLCTSNNKNSATPSLCVKLRVWVCWVVTSWTRGCAFFTPPTVLHIMSQSLSHCPHQLFGSCHKICPIADLMCTVTKLNK